MVKEVGLVTALVVLYEPLAKNLRELSELKVKDSSLQANSLLCSLITDCQFVHSLCSLKVLICANKP